MRILIVSAVSLCLAVSAARADALIDGAKSCTQYFPANEQTYRIPVHLLAAIASAESGRWHDGLGMPLPWPWTINAAGKGYYLDSKAEAIAKAQSLMAQGITSMDVGCMQVNLKHHQQAFASLNDAFDPQKNVAYAAKFLRTNYDDLGDWVRAAAAYHSRTPNLGSKYLKRIEITWNRIVERVRMAQAKAGGVVADIPAENPMTMKVVTPASVQSDPPVQRSIPGTRGVKVLQVNDAPSQHPAPSLIVMQQRPAPRADAPFAVTVTNPATRDDLLVAGNQARTLDKPSQGAQKKPITHFVFAN